MPGNLLKQAVITYKHVGSVLEALPPLLPVHLRSSCRLAFMFTVLSVVCHMCGLLWELIAVRCRLAEGEGKRAVSLDGPGFTFLKCAFRKVIVRDHREAWEAEAIPVCVSQMCCSSCPKIRGGLCRILLWSRAKAEVGSELPQCV